MPNCSVLCCTKRTATSFLQKDGITFHKFPKDPGLRDIWKKFCNKRRTWMPTINAVICSEHFLPSDFQILENTRRILIEGTKPSVLSNCTCYKHSSLFTPLDSSTSAITLSPIQHTESKHENSILISTDGFTPRERKMKLLLNMRKEKIKRLQLENQYLRRKAAALQEILHTVDEKSFIDEEKSILEGIGIEEKELF